MKIGIISDHRGVQLKEKLIQYLNSLGIEVINYGTNSEESVDYPKYAFLLGEALKSKEIDKGIAICMTGVGMSIATSKVKGVRAARILSSDEAIMARRHNDLNIICLPNIELENAIEIVDAFINTSFDSDERHQRRIDLIKEYEENHD